MFRLLASDPGPRSFAYEPDSEEGAITEVGENLFRSSRRNVLTSRAALGGVALVFVGSAIAVNQFVGRLGTTRKDADKGAVQVLDDISCTGTEQDCRSTRCCKRSGQTCFEKNEYWATCMDTCAPGLHDGDTDGKPWSCNKLGNRTKFTPGCSWPGTDCSETKACCTPGFKCVKKDDQWTACQQVEVGPWTNNVPTKKLPVPAGWDGTTVGGWRNEFKIWPVTEEWQKTGTSLFCFFAILAGSYEEALVQSARDRKASIFGCEEHAIYHSQKSKYHQWETGVKTLVNTAAFVKVWDHVRADGRYSLHDWTVKVDADAIFFPARLRSHLLTLGAPAYRQIYIKNTLARFTLGGFLGAIEVLSKQATDTFLDNSAGCNKYIGMMSGEDGFLKDCMDSLGVGYMHDEILLHPSVNPIECQMQEFVAYHPQKAPNTWIQCYDLAAGNIPNPPAMIQASIDALPQVLKDKYTAKAQAAAAAAAAAAAEAAAKAAADAAAAKAAEEKEDEHAEKA